MKKIIFASVPMANKAVTYHTKYKVYNNPSLEWNKEIILPLSSVLFNTLKKEDIVKVILIKEQQDEQEDQHYEKQVKEEIEEIESIIGCEIKIKIIKKKDEEDIFSHEKLFEKLIDELEENVEIYADVTYGTKTLPFIIFNVLTFAAQICNARIVNISYGKIKFKKGEQQQKDSSDKKSNSQIKSAVIFNLSSLY